MARAEGILRLLVVDDSLTEADGIINSLRSAGHAVRATREDKLTTIEQLINSQAWDLLICRDTVPDLAPLDLINLIHRLGKDIPFLVLATDNDKEQQLFDIGAQDVVLYGDNKRLQFAVDRELNNLFMRRLSRRNERALRESEKRSRALLESSLDAVAYMHEGMHIYVNRAYLKLFGYEEAEDIDGLPILDLIVGDDHGKFKSAFRQFSEQADGAEDTVSVQCVKSDGTPFRARMEFSHAQVEGENCTQVVIRDEDLNSEAEEQLQLLKNYDILTGLYSRSRFMDELQKVINAVAEGRSEGELLYLVLDDFQHIKEQVGLVSTDVVVKGVAELLRKHLKPGEVLGRYADQVFTIIVPVNDEEEVMARASQFQKVVADYAFQADGKSIDTHCSIGVCRLTENFASAESVLEAADRACLEAQRSGSDRVARYQPASPQSQPQVAVHQQRDWKQDLQDALNNDGFSLYFQPIVSLHGEEQEFYEVLLRLQQDGGKLLKAEAFINDAESLGLMAEIDKWVIRNGLGKLAEHRQQHPRTRFFIKLSTQTLAIQDFVDWLCASLNAHNLDGSALIFEISETAAVENIELTQSVIAKLKAIGCEFGLEHFGSGIDFSQSLDALDVSYLKINGTFVENMSRDAENQAAVKAIIEITRQAGKRCIAEFVSDANSLALLWRLGVDYAQGFYIHEPSDKLDYNFEEDDL